MRNPVIDQSLVIRSPPFVGLYLRLRNRVHKICWQAAHWMSRVIVGNDAISKVIHCDLLSNAHTPLSVWRLVAAHVGADILSDFPRAQLIFKAAQVLVGRAAFCTWPGQWNGVASRA